MGFDPSIRQKIKKLAVTMKNKVSETQFYASQNLKKYLVGVARRMTDIEKLNINVCYDDPNGTVGCTDGDNIFLNCNSSLITFFTNAEARFVAFMGVFFHEIAHCVFLDFNEERKAADSLENGKFYGELKTTGLTTQELDDLDSMKKAMEDKTIRPVFLRVFHELSNIISDRHDEDALIEMYGSYVGEPIYAARHSLQANSILYEDMKSYVDTGKCSELVFFYSLLLQITRFGDVVARDPEKMELGRYWELLAKIRKHADIACITDDTFRKYEELNSIMLLLWPFIRNEIQKMKQNSQNQGQGNSSDQQPGGSGNSSNNQQQSRSGDGSQQQNGQNGDNSSDNSLSPEQLQKILDGLQQASKNAGGMSQMPQNRSSSDTAKQKRQDAQSSDSGEQQNQNNGQSGNGQSDPSGNDSGSQSSDSSAQGAAEQQGSAQNAGSSNDSGQFSAQAKTSQKPEAGQSSGSSVQNTMADIMQSIAEDKAESEMEKQATDRLTKEIGNISQPDIHADISISIDRNLEVTDRDVARYEACMKELRPYSKRLQKQMLDALRDLREGYVDKHKPYGRNLVAADAYRPDQKYFSNKKAPQDLPDMAVYVLVDHSGSMSSTDSKSGKQRIEVSMEAAMLLHDFATGINIPVAVGGHSAGSVVRYQIYSDFEQISSKDKYRLAKMTTSGCNRDGMCLNIAANLLAKRPEQLKLLIIISDGLPNHYGYSGEIAKQDIQNIIKSCKRKNIDVLAAGIGDDREQVKNIYGENFIDISDLSMLPKTLTGIVKKRVIASAR